MMINFMQRPYEYYLNADTSVIQRSITSDVNNMYGLILSLLQLISEIIVFICLTVYCLTTDVVMTGTVAALLIVVLVIIKCILKPIMRKAGEENQDFYSGLLGISLAGATLPVLAFLLLGVYGRLLWLVVPAALLGVGHIGVHLSHWRELKAQKKNP